MGLLSKWTNGEREAPEPLEGPVVGTVITGTVIWSVLFLAQLPFYGWFEDGGHTWWLWTCAAGAGLGLLGIWIVRRRDAALRREAGLRPAETGRAPDTGGAPETAGERTDVRDRLHRH